MGSFVLYRAIGGAGRAGSRRRRPPDTRSVRLRACVASHKKASCRHRGAKKNFVPMPFYSHMDTL